MRYRMLDGTGLEVSELCLGSATFGVAPVAEAAIALVHRAIDAGINFIDTANSYGNQSRFDRAGVVAAPHRAWAEEILGTALMGCRDRVVLSSKVGEPVGSTPNSGSWEGGGLTRRHIVGQLETTLRRLGTDHLDIYYAHHPDPKTPVEEWLSTFDDLIRAGKIRHYALSTFTGWQLMESVLSARPRGLRAPACHQTRYSVVDRWVEREVLPASRHGHLSTVVFSPLAGGLLTSSYGSALVGASRWGGPAPSLATEAAVRRCHDLARDWGRPVEELALGWLLARQDVGSLVVGPESSVQLEELVAATEASLSAEELAELDGVTPPPEPFWHGQS
ncbi:aldo/keto reductase [Dactylosporangium roseum]